MIKIIEHKQPYVGEERETHYNFDDTTNTAKVESFNSSIIRSLVKLANERPDEVTVLREYILKDASGDRMDGIMVELPKRWIKIRTPRILTDEQRKGISDRFLQAKASANSTNAL
jgi:hypothetical protein